MLIAEKIYNMRLKEHEATLAREEFVRVMSKFGVLQAYFQMRFETTLTKESFKVTFFYNVQRQGETKSYEQTISFPEDESRIKGFGHRIYKKLDFICQNAVLNDR